MDYWGWGALDNGFHYYFVPKEMFTFLAHESCKRSIIFKNFHQQEIAYFNCDISLYDISVVGEGNLDMK